MNHHRDAWTAYAERLGLVQESARFLVVPWERICRDNATASDAESVPLLLKDCMGSVARSPIDWFDQRNFITDLKRHCTQLPWI